MQTRRRRIWLWSLGSLLALLTILVLLWDWDWFRPLVEARASAALGRRVSLEHLSVELSLHPRIVLEGLQVANPDDFPKGSQMASLDRLAVRVNPWAYFRGRIDLLEVEIDRPSGDLRPGTSGKPNWQFSTHDAAPSPGTTPSPVVSIDRLEIRDGKIHFLDPQFKSDFTVTVHTEGADAGEPRIVVTADGTYSGQPVSARFVGGSILRLRDPADPYPVDLHIAHGATTVSLKGTLLDPMQFAGADLQLDLRGDDLASLYPLTGIPLAPTPPYRLQGELDYAKGQIRFRSFEGTVGGSDLSGDLSVEPGHERRRVMADMHSKKVVADLAVSSVLRPARPARRPKERSRKQNTRHRRRARNCCPPRPSTYRNFAPRTSTSTTRPTASRAIPRRWMTLRCT